MSRKSSNLSELKAAPELGSGTRMPGAVVGRLLGLAGDGYPLVGFPGSDGPPVAARCVVPLDSDELTRLAEANQEVLLVFDGDDVSRPIITGLLRAPVSGMLPKNERARPETALVDGRRVRFVAEDEIVLECGEASITLRRNGRVVIRGTHLESDSLGANWIRGLDIQLG